MAVKGAFNLGVPLTGSLECTKKSGAKVDDLAPQVSGGKLSRLHREPPGDKAAAPKLDQ
jgi:hypothetical protein